MSARLRRAVVALFAGAALSLGGPAAGQAALPAVFVGLCSDQVYWQENEAVAVKNVDLQRRAGIDISRVAIRWADLERTPGVWNYAMADRVVRRLAEGGIRMLPVLQSPPAFADAAPVNPQPGFYPPKSFAQFADFGARMIRRYGRGGTFWSENPHVPYLPLTAWQVWNEPNIRPWWASGPNAAEYVDLLKATAGALRSVDPQVEVVAAGIPNSRLGIPQQTYLRQMYEAGAQEAFDTLALHGYSSTVEGLMNQLRLTRGLMDEHNDASRIWLTEFGWATGGAVSAFTTTEEGQAARIDAAVRALAAERDSLRLRGFMLFTWQDVVGFGTIWPYFSGLIRADGSPKPGGFSFLHAVAAIRVAAGETGLPDPPADPVAPPATALPVPLDPKTDAGDEAAPPVDVPIAPEDTAATDPDDPPGAADPPPLLAGFEESSFRVLRARPPGALGKVELTYFPEQGGTLMLNGHQLPFAVADGCPLGCRLRAKYDVRIRVAGPAGPVWRRIRVPGQRLGLRMGEPRTLKLVLSPAQLAAVRSARKTRIDVALQVRRKPSARAAARGTLRIVLAPVSA
jgi:hypothetical protein